MPPTLLEISEQAAHQVGYVLLLQLPYFSHP